MKRDRFLGITLFVLALCACTKKETVAPQLSKTELQAWLERSFAGGAPLRFFSSDVIRQCCEYPNISLELIPEQKMKIAVDGWEPKKYNATYTVEDDGTIVLPASDASSLPRLDGQPVERLFVVRDGTDVYRLKSSQRDSDHPNSKELWPLVFIASDDWRPSPSHE